MSVLERKPNIMKLQIIQPRNPKKKLSGSRHKDMKYIFFLSYTFVYMKKERNNYRGLKWWTEWKEIQANSFDKIKVQQNFPFKLEKRKEKEVCRIYTIKFPQGRWIFYLAQDSNLTISNPFTFPFRHEKFNLKNVNFKSWRKIYVRNAKERDLFVNRLFQWFQICVLSFFFNNLIFI